MLAISILYQGWAFDAVAALWIVWYAYWVGSWIYETARGERKQSIRSQRSIAQAATMILALILLFAQFNGQLSFLTIRFLPAYAAIQLVGVMIAAVGVLFAIWARIHLGGNWSNVPALKKGQTLVKAGPYLIVRHPIYTGILLIVVGSAVVVGQYRGLIAILCIAVFTWLRILEEEKIMTGKFGKEYLAYKKKVKAIIPGII